MGFVGDLLGFGGGKGGGFNASGVNLLQPVSLDQAQGAFNPAQSGLNQQQSFLNALQGQNGIQNQNALYSQLSDLSQGKGPNPALDQLNQVTRQNVANQAALMAGQRGSSANAGLLARQIANQGANVQQQAAGQAATLQSQQQLGALGAMGNLANTQVAQQQQGLMGYNQAAQSEQQALLNAINQYNNQNVAMQSNINASNAGIQAQNAKGQQGLLGGALGGLGAVAGFFADGGEVQNGPASFAGKFLKGFREASDSMGPGVAPMSLVSSAQDPEAARLQQGAADAIGGIGKSIYNAFHPAPSAAGVAGAAAAPVMMPGMSPMSGAMSGALSGFGRATMGLEAGGRVPGKAAVSGNSLKNDTVPAMLSPGEVVLPRSVMKSADPVNNAAKFVEAILARQGLRKKA